MFNLDQLPDNINVTVSKKDLFALIDTCLKKGHNNQHKFYPEYLTIKQLAEYINYSEPAIYKMVADASIPCIKISGKLLFRRNEIDEWLNDFRQPTVKEKMAELDAKNH